MAVTESWEKFSISTSEKELIAKTDESLTKSDKNDNKSPSKKIGKDEEMNKQGSIEDRWMTNR